MQGSPEKAPSRRARIALYLAGVAAIALPWGYLLFVRPWLHARRRSSIAPYAASLAIRFPSYDLHPQ
jgi:hypothetical protein